MSRLPTAARDAIRAALDQTRAELTHARGGEERARTALRLATAHVEQLTAAETDLAHALDLDDATPNEAAPGPGKLPDALTQRPLIRCMGGAHCHHTPGTCTATRYSRQPLTEEPPRPVLAGTIAATDLLSVTDGRPLSVTAAAELADRARQAAGPGATTAQLIAHARRLAADLPRDA